MQLISLSLRNACASDAVFSILWYFTNDALHVICPSAQLQLIFVCQSTADFVWWNDLAGALLVLRVACRRVSVPSDDEMHSFFFPRNYSDSLDSVTSCICLVIIDAILFWYATAWMSPFQFNLLRGLLPVNSIVRFWRLGLAQLLSVDASGCHDRWMCISTASFRPLSLCYFALGSLMSVLDASSLAFGGSHFLHRLRCSCCQRLRALLYPSILYSGRHSRP